MFVQHFHNKYEQISNSLISIRDPITSKKNGGKNGKNIPKENRSKRRNPVLSAYIGEKKLSWKQVRPYFCFAQVRWRQPSFIIIRNTENSSGKIHLNPAYQNRTQKKTGGDDKRAENKMKRNLQSQFRVRQNTKLASFFFFWPSFFEI